MNARFCSVTVAALAVAAICIPRSGDASPATAAVVAPAANVIDEGCWSTPAQMCQACPNNRQWMCVRDLNGPYTSCTDVFYSPCLNGNCPTTHTTTGPGCPVPP
jgi:hypothetical protein